MIAGSGRSGTTWVLDSLATANSMRTLFEPLHPIGVREAAQFAYQYVDKYDTNNDLKRFMGTVFSGEMSSIWANYRIRPDRFNIFRYGLRKPYFHLKKFYRHYNKYSLEGNNGLIVKVIRANLMLPWICEHFDVRAVLIIRHPCAVVASIIELPEADWSAEKAIARYRNNPNIVNLIRDKFGVDIKMSMTSSATLAAVWCIENMLPIEWAGESHYEIVSYEDLLMDKGTEWKQLVTYLGLKNVPEASLRESPSQQVSREMRDKNITSQHIDKWKQKLNDQALLDISAMLNKFGCRYYSVDNSMPRLRDRNFVDSEK